MHDYNEVSNMFLLTKQCTHLVTSMIDNYRPSPQKQAPKYMEGKKLEYIPLVERLNGNRDVRMHRAASQSIFLLREQVKRQARIITLADVSHREKLGHERVG